jgi:predicted phosphodiesterase
MDYPPEAESRYRTVWTREKLSASSYDWLKSLPIEENIELDGWKIKVRHANPWDTNSYLYEDSPLLSKILIPKKQVLVLGHTHRPYMIKRGDGMVINCGSVGQPRSGLPGAQISEFDTTRGLWKQFNIEYDYNGMQVRLKSMGWNEKVVKKLSLE